MKISKFESELLNPVQCMQGGLQEMRRELGLPASSLLHQGPQPGLPRKGRQREGQMKVKVSIENSLFMPSAVTFTCSVTCREARREI